MNTSKFIKSVNEENQFIFAVEAENFETVRLADCYSQYGQQLGSYYSQDYSLHNSASDAKSNCIKELVEHFDLNEEASFYISIDSNEKFVLEADIDLPEDFLYECEKFIEEWEEENAEYEYVTAYTYFDGNNFKSVIIEQDNIESAITHEVIDDEALIFELSKANSTKEIVKEERGVTTYKSDNFEILTSLFPSDFSDFTILETN